MGININRVLKSFFTYPLTYLVIFIIILVHVIFSNWFSANIFMNSLAVCLDIFAFGLWFTLVFSSGKFREHFSRLPYQEQIGSLKEILAGCQPDFKDAALKSLDIIQKIKADFDDHQYDSEMDAILYNISNLAKNHQALFLRLDKFGTVEQKNYMRTVLNKQLGSVQNALRTLQTFSGNLTLIAADSGQTTVSTNTLKDINKGLQEVMEELK